VWLSIEETTDVDVWHIADVVIGTLESDGTGTTMFLNTEFIILLRTQLFQNYSKNASTLALTSTLPQKHDSTFIFEGDTTDMM